eukprot:CAMPEP_0113594254 /NCGR_PEP_ID=MMETSP0015_2-20120614/38954_1 /TAXON_ID=2838 /ORGANISM="Odontella" /LENGTH=107 /DNA_ID=CAMNT_0000501189 /DNA_START=743 /DNA_END=1066 /DNA_ORIENTATION=+ /assembly_acc=CAM_ASM_000160
MRSGRYKIFVEMLHEGKGDVRRRSRHHQILIGRGVNEFDPTAVAVAVAVASRISRFEEPSSRFQPGLEMRAREDDSTSSPERAETSPRLHGFAAADIRDPTSPPLRP